MPKASRRKRLTRPPKWTRRAKLKPKKPVIDGSGTGTLVPLNSGAVPAEAAPYPVPVPIPCTVSVPVPSFAVATTCQAVEPETLPLPHNVAIPVPVGQEDFPVTDGDSDLPMLRNTDDLIQCLKDHLKKWKEP